MEKPDDMGRIRADYDYCPQCEKHIIPMIDDNGAYCLTHGTDTVFRQTEETITIVAVIGGVGDWAAYASNPSTGHDSQAIIGHGTKIKPDLAEKLFPNWNIENWRA